MEKDDSVYINGFRFPVIISDDVLGEIMNKYRNFASINNRHLISALKDRLRQAGCLQENGRCHARQEKETGKIKVGNQAFIPKSGKLTHLFLKLEVSFKKQKIAILLPVPSSDNFIPSEEFIRIRKGKEEKLNNEEMEKIMNLIHTLNNCLEAPKESTLVPVPISFHL